MQMLTNWICEEGRVEVKSARRLLAILDSGSVGLQKFNTMYFPFRASRSVALVEEERVRSGASSPICNEWLPKGIEDDKNAANTNDKNKYLVFTISRFRLHNSYPASLLTLFMDNNN